MRKIKFIIKKEFIQLRRDPAIIRILFLIPIIQLLILGYIVSSEVTNLQTVICDLDNSSLSRELVRQLQVSEYFTVKYFDQRQSHLVQYLDSGKASVALVIPEGLSVKLKKNLAVQIQILIDGQDSNTSTIALSYLNNIFENFLSDYLKQQLRGSAATAIHLITPDIRIWYNEELKFSNFMIPGLIVFLLTIVTSLISAMGLVREKEIGTLEQILVTPVKKHELLIGKIIPFALIGLIVMAIAVAFAKVWYHIPIEGNLGVFALFVFFYLFTTLGIGLFVSATAHTQQQAMFLTFFILIFFMFFSGFLFPIENMPKPAQYLSYLDPMHYLILVVREIFIKGSSFNFLYWQGFALLVFGAVIFSLAVLKFQKKLS